MNHKPMLAGNAAVPKTSRAIPSSLAGGTAATPKDWRAKYKTEPFPSVGVWCTFYYEGGHGDGYWCGGWRPGKILAIPIKGQHKGWMQVELVAAYKANPSRAWVHSNNVNRLGDIHYHGPKAAEIVAAMEATKAANVKSHRPKRELSTASTKAVGSHAG